MAAGFYQSKEWQRLRSRHIRAYPWCAMAGCRERAKHVDHIKTVKEAPQRKLDPSNLQSLCAFHHGALTAAFDRGSIAGVCDENGMPLDPAHPWNQASNQEAIDTVNREHKPDSSLTARLKRQAVTGKHS